MMKRNFKQALYRLVWLSTLLSLATLISPAQSAIYKWTDEKGRVHYSDQKPINLDDVANIEDSLPGNFYEGSKVDFGEVFGPKENTQHLDINIQTYDYNISQKDRRAIKAVINKMFNVYANLFHWPRGKSYPINIQVHGSEASYRNAQQKITGKWVSASGFFSPSKNIAVVRARQDRSKTYSVVFHEASHAIMHAKGRYYIPNWINEGLAEYFENASIKKGRLIIGIPKDKKQTLIGMLNDNSLSSLTRFFAIPNHKWRKVSGDKTWDYYTLGWSIITYMMQTQTRRNILSGLIQEAQKRPGSFDAKAYISSQYKDGFNQFARRWRNWIKHTVYK